METEKFSTTFTYDNKGRMETRTHPSGITETNHYNSYGYLDYIAAGGATRFTVTAMNARQQVTGATYGASLIGEFGFDDYGYPTYSKAQNSGTYRQDYRYSFDGPTGNLNSRQNYLRNKSESFSYDNLDRLTGVTGPQNLTMGYAANGNITAKSDVGSVFKYEHPTKPYALTGAETSSGLISDDTQVATYTSFEQVSNIDEGYYNASFTYNSDGQRAQMLIITDLGTTWLTRWYVGSRFIKETNVTTTVQYTWIGGDAYSAPVVAEKVGATTNYYYLLRDYLGNITHKVNTSNTVVAEYSYDAWGRRRDKDDWSYTLSGEPELLAGRGFTGHEFLSDFNLYNMNGRLYDPVVGRFLSADNYIQDPANSQNFNRYSYCLNNPLVYTDPTGEKWKWKWLNPLYWFSELMQQINDNTTGLKQKMIELNIPDFGVGGSINRDGDINVNASYRGQEVLNTENIDKSNPNVVYKELAEVRQNYGAAWRDASLSGDTSPDNILGKLFWHNQFGGQKDFVINASSMDFGYTNQKELGIENKNQGEINLFDAGINSYSLAFGVLNVDRLGTSDFFKVETNRFDFDYQSGKSFGRTAGTFVGGAAFGQFFNTPITPWSYIRNNSTIGGPFDVIFNYQIYIPKY